MNKTFVKELVVTNYLFIGFFAIIIIVCNLIYGGTIESWSQSLGILLILTIAITIKIRRIKAKTEQLDERVQLITYRAISVGFYFLLGAIFWFYTKELIIEGQVSSRTVFELLAGMLGYLGGYIILNKRY